MAIEVVNQDSVLDRALTLVNGARRRVWITSPWITQRAANLLLRDLLSRIQNDHLDVRIVYRVKEPSDLEITDLEVLNVFEGSGCRVRYSTRLHAKLLLVDDNAAIVSSSNLTATAGYALDTPPEWRNEELGVLVRDQTEVLRELERQFSAIWDSATSIEPDTIGIAMDFPTVREFSFVAIRDVRLGEYASASNLRGDVIVGRVIEVTAYNRSFPRMGQTVWLTQGYPGAPDQRGAVEIPDLQSLFSHPSKEHGFLVAKTFFEPESAFRIAKVEVLKHLEGDRLVAASVPVAPGSEVRRASASLLRRLLGDGDVLIGTVLHHSEVEVFLRGTEILSKHLAVLGMTGSGKSNAIKVLIREILSGNPNLCALIIDTHGEYTTAASGISPQRVVLDVDLRQSVLDPGVIKSLLRLSRHEEAFNQKLAEVADALSEGASLEDFLNALDFEAGFGGPAAARLRRLAEVARQRTDLCLWPEEGARIVRAGGEEEDLVVPGLYVLDLRHTPELERRSAKAAAAINHVFRRGKESGGAFPALIVVDEAQNYAPEQQTGWLSRARPVFDAIFAVASEGRKFGVGLVISTQRPARVNKDVLSQCNTHMIFRVANVEDLAAIAGSFEAASKPLLDELPGFDPGVCVVGGTAVGMVTRVEVPLFAQAISGVGG